MSAFGGLSPWNQKTNTVSLFLPSKYEAQLEWGRTEKDPSCPGPALHLTQQTT